MDIFQNFQIVDDTSRDERERERVPKGYEGFGKVIT